MVMNDRSTSLAVINHAKTRRKPGQRPRRVRRTVERVNNGNQLVQRRPAALLTQDRDPGLGKQAQRSSVRRVLPRSKARRTPVFMLDKRSHDRISGPVQNIKQLVVLHRGSEARKSVPISDPSVIRRGLHAPGFMAG